PGTVQEQGVCYAGAAQCTQNYFYRFCPATAGDRKRTVGRDSIQDLFCGREECGRSGNTDGDQGGSRRSGRRAARFFRARKYRCNCNRKHGQGVHQEKSARKRSRQGGKERKVFRICSEGVALTYPKSGLPRRSLRRG